MMVPCKIVSEIKQLLLKEEVVLMVELTQTHLPIIKVEVVQLLMDQLEVVQPATLQVEIQQA